MKWRSISLCGLILLLSSGGPGCRTVAEQSPQDQSLDVIARKAKGDWSKLSAADRDTLTRQVGHGSPQTAQMNFQARWSRLNGGKNAAPPVPPGPR